MNGKCALSTNGSRSGCGIVEVVTGGGKTVFAQMCLQVFFEEMENGQVLIIVPTVSLLDQWWIALQDESGVSPDDIGLLSGQETCEGDEPIIISVINSARRFTKEFSRDRRLFLIVDECHRAGSPANAKAMLGEFVATLGLSATPEREYDEGFAVYIAPLLGPIIHEYTYIDASRDGVISPFSLTNVRVDMLPDEEEEYRKYARSIAKLLRTESSDDADEQIETFTATPCGSVCQCYSPHPRSSQARRTPQGRARGRVP